MGDFIAILIIGAFMFFIMRRGGGCCGGHGHSNHEKGNKGSCCHGHDSETKNDIK